MSRGCFPDGSIIQSVPDVFPAFSIPERWLTQIYSALSRSLSVTTAVQKAGETCPE